MFLLEEKQRLNQLFSNIKSQTVDEILSEPEIEAIQNSTTPLEKIRNRLVAPKSLLSRTTIRLQRLCIDFELFDWLKAIADKIFCSNFFFNQAGSEAS